MDKCTDGTLKTTGKKHFTCAHGKGLYFPLASLHPDERFGLQAGHAATSIENRERAFMYPACRHTCTLVWPSLSNCMSGI